MKNLRPKLFLSILLCTVFLIGIPYAVNAQANPNTKDHDPKIRHILLISVDGLHALDLTRYVNTYPHSALATLSKDGVTYNNASTSEPSDSVSWHPFDDHRRHTAFNRCLLRRFL